MRRRIICEIGPWVILCLLMGVRILFPSLSDVNHAGFPRYGIICLILFLAALTAIPAVWYSVSRSSSRFDRHLGNLTYPLYLFHTLVATGYYHLRDDIPFLANGAFGKVIGSCSVIFFSTLGAILIYVLVDIPFEQVRNRLMKQFKLGKNSEKIPQKI